MPSTAIVERLLEAADRLLGLRPKMPSICTPGGSPERLRNSNSTWTPRTASPCAAAPDGDDRPSARSAARRPRRRDAAARLDRADRGRRRGAEVPVHRDGVPVGAQQLLQGDDRMALVATADDGHGWMDRSRCSCWSSGSRLRRRPPDRAPGAPLAATAGPRRGASSPSHGRAVVRLSTLARVSPRGRAARRRAAGSSLAVGLEQRVDEVADLVERQLAGRVRVEHRRVVGRLAAPGQRRLDREPLDVDVRLHQRGEVARQRADRLRRDRRPAPATHGTSTQQSSGRLSIRRPPSRGGWGRCR